MKNFRNRLVGLVTATALIATGCLSAQDGTFVGGRGYQEYRIAPNLAPGIALGVIALAAVLAVALQNSTNAHGHGHIN